MQLLNKLSEILHKFARSLFFKIVVLKAVSYSKPFSNFKHLQQRSSLGNLQIFRRALFLVVNSEIACNISWKFCIHLFVICILLMCYLLMFSRRFNLAGDMTNLYPFIQVSLEWPSSELFSASLSLWNQYKYIVFNIFPCRIVIISQYFTSQYFTDKN